MKMKLSNGVTVEYIKAPEQMTVVFKDKYEFARVFFCDEDALEYFEDPVYFKDDILLDKDYVLTDSDYASMKEFEETVLGDVKVFFTHEKYSDSNDSDDEYEDKVQSHNYRALFTIFSVYFLAVVVIPTVVVFAGDYQFYRSLYPHPL